MAENTLEIVIEDKGGGSSGGGSFDMGRLGSFATAQKKQQDEQNYMTNRMGEWQAEQRKKNEDRAAKQQADFEAQKAAQLKRTVQMGRKIEDSKTAAEEEKKAAFSKRIQGAANIALATGGGGASGQSASGLANAGLGVATAMGGTAGAMAAGPVGMAVAAGAKVVDMAVQQMADDVKAKREFIEHMTQQAQALLSNNHRQMFDNAVDHVSKGMEKIPIVGKLYAEQIQLMAAPVRAFADVMNAAVEQGKRLQQYNGNIAGANAQADVRSMQRDIQEAQRLGKDYARITEAQSQMDDTLRELLLPIKEFLVENLATVVEGIAFDLKLAKEGIYAIPGVSLILGAPAAPSEESLPLVRFYELLDQRISAPGRGPAVDPSATIGRMGPAGGERR